MERAILLAVCQQNQEEEVRNSLEELEELCRTAGAEAVYRVTQNREYPHPGTYVGKGKIEEIRELMAQYEANTLVVDDELSPAQLKNLQGAIEGKVIDRTILILDIFAKHAHTKEGALQVELAQYKYRLTRLTGLGASLSRLAGGIGTRGPGESKLESDRRHIRRRLELLQDELAEVRKHRDLLRNARKKLGKPVVAIVGYTNAGKSTLLNQLASSNVLEEDKLFATLDPTTRLLELPDGKEILLTDTVGFIRKLPHHLIEAFKSTLEEAAYADLLIHVVDATHPDAERHMEVVMETLESLDAVNKPMMTVFNKCDREDARTDIKDINAFKTLFISAKTRSGMDELMEALNDKLREGSKLIKKIIPYSEGSKLQNVRTFGQIILEEYVADGVYVEAYLEEALVNKYFGLNENDN